MRSPKNSPRPEPEHRHTGRRHLSRIGHDALRALTALRDLAVSRVPTRCAVAGLLMIPQSISAQSVSSDRDRRLIGAASGELRINECVVRQAVTHLRRSDRNNASDSLGVKR